MWLWLDTRRSACDSESLPLRATLPAAFARLLALVAAVLSLCAMIATRFLAHDEVADIANVCSLALFVTALEWRRRIVRDGIEMRVATLRRC